MEYFHYVSRQHKKNILDEAFDKHYQSLCYFAISFLKDSALAEDIVQDAFINLWNNFENIKDGQEKFVAYLYRSVRNSCLNHIRDQKVRNAASEQIKYISDNWEEEHVHNLIRAEVYRSLHTSIEKLPKQCRRIFQLAYFKGMSEKQIADKLGISIHSVKSQKQRGKAILKKEMGAMFLMWVLMN